ncbi:neprilysin-3-like [Dermacentor silvarum]|uniref:neprilysin-3-like n=1 Tax=Dermacentor silvarum TaxID=543639 RepID=UPI0018976F53|nr:neprilysin-3-like [Dermacentor silvarum]
MDALENLKRPTRPASQYSLHCVRLLVVAFVATLVVLLWLLAFHMSGSARSARAESETNQTGHRCSSGRCKETARLLKSFRSNHTSPCVDFYEHVCAGVQGTEEASVGGSDLVVMRQMAAAATASIVRHALARGVPRLQQTAGQKASAFLQLCRARSSRHEDNLSVLRSYVESSRLFDQDADFNPLVKIAEHLFVQGLPLFYQVGVEEALVWRRRYLLTVEVSAVTVLWLKTQRAFPGQESYTKHVLKVLQGAGIGRDRADALSVTIADLEDVVHAAYHQYLVEKRNNSNMLIVRLEEQASLFSNDTQTKREWSEFVMKNVTMGHSSVVHVLIEEGATHFLKNIVDKLSVTELRTLIAWEVIREIVTASGVVPLVGDYTQWYCVQMTLRIYGHGLTVPYFQSSVTRKTLRVIGNTYANIKYYMMKAANATWWLRESSLNTTRRIMRRLKTRIIFPHALDAKDALDEYYVSCPDVKHPFLSSYLIASRARAEGAVTLAASLSARISSSDPRKYVAMAAYNRKTNALFLSGSSTFAPALDTKGPVEVNYGFFGRIVAQGIMRILDKYTDEPKRPSRLNKFWTSDAGRNLKDLALCLEKQANELEERSAPYSQRLHRFRSAARTTAHGEASSVLLPVVLEALGLAPLYEAYVDARKDIAPYQPLVLPGLEELSEERLFFFSWCYSLCSGERAPKGRAALRCNLAVANQAPFINAFSCHPGLPMNPIIKCPLW